MSSQHLYTYGTLQVASIIELIVGRPFRGVAARLDDYARYRVRERVYPAIVASLGARVSGVLYPDLAPDELERLDLYEGSLYQRRVVSVRVGPVATPAVTYVLRPEFRQRLSDEPWDLEVFLRDHLDAYLALVSQTSRAP